MTKIIAFAHIPKTAGTTLVSILRRSYGIRHFDRPGFYRPLTAHDLRQIRKIYRSLASLAGHTIQPHTDLHKAHPIKYYTFFRDPQKRLISEFKFLLRRGAYDGVVHSDFAKCWNSWIPTRSNYQCKYLANEESADTAIEIVHDRIPFIGLLEQFDESLVMFKKWVNDPLLDIHYKTLNKGDGGSEHGRVPESYMKDIDDFCAALETDATYSAHLSHAIAEDRKLFEHACNIIYPAQKNAYGKSLEQDLRQFKQENGEMEIRSTESKGSKLFRDLVWKPARPFLLKE